MIPDKLGQRIFPPQEGWANTVLWIQLHGNQKNMNKGDFLGSMNRGHFFRDQRNPLRVRIHQVLSDLSYS